MCVVYVLSWSESLAIPAARGGGEVKGKATTTTTARRKDINYRHACDLCCYDFWTFLVCSLFGHRQMLLRMLSMSIFLLNSLYIYLYTDHLYTITKNMLILTVVYAFLPICYISIFHTQLTRVCGPFMEMRDSK